MSIVSRFWGNWIMDRSRLVPAGTAVLALLIVLPLGYQLFGTTALSPPHLPAVPTKEALPASIPAEPPAAPGPKIATAAATEAPKPVADDTATADASADQLAGGAGLAKQAAAPAAAARESFAPPAPLAAPSGDRFQSFAESPLKVVATDPVSTFSIDVDTASYAYVRRALNEGRIPDPDAVRIEEMINYLPYDYPAPASAAEPFKPTVAVFPTPWNEATELMRIGIKGYAPPAAARPPSNLVFLIDTSGSMAAPDKLPLLQQALRLLVNTLSGADTVSIVAYAGSAGVGLEPSRASD
jgi:Ca-activated chloride channel family protein